MRHPMNPGTFTVSSGYGPRWSSFHWGIDFAAPLGTPIYAPADGLVIEGKERAQGSVSGFGSWVWLDCQKSESLDFIFGHVQHHSITVKRGDRVKQGQLIARVGTEGQSTGPHLHFECWTAPGRVGGKAVDPAPILAQRTNPKETLPMAAKPKITDIHMDFGFGYARNAKDIQAIFVHTTENTFSSKAINVGRWQAGGKSTGNTGLGSYHVLVDRTELVLCNTDDWVAYGTGNLGNQRGLQLSFVAQARSTRDQWLAEERNHGTLSRGAWQVAQWCRKHNIPVEYVNGNQLRAGKRGISTHNEARVAWGVTDHTDPGKGFPMDVFLDLVRKQLDPTAPAAYTPKHQKETPTVDLNTVVQTAVAGSDFKDTLANFIRYADANSFVAKKNSEALMQIAQRMDARLSALEKQVTALGDTETTTAGAAG